MKEVCKYILFLVITVICGFLVCISLFRTNVFANIHVLMYRGIILTIITGILLLVVLLTMSEHFDKKGKDCFDKKDAISASIVFVCIHLAFFTLVPVTVERSVSVYTLSRIYDIENQTISKSDAEKLFIDGFVYKNDAFAKRFDEQIVTGSIKENADGTFTLTDRGRWLVEMFKYIGKIYHADMKNMTNE